MIRAVWTWLVCIAMTLFLGIRVLFHAALGHRIRPGMNATAGSILAGG